MLMFASVAHGAEMKAGLYAGAAYLKLEIDEDYDAFGYRDVVEADESANGYRLHPHLAMELSYIDSSDFDGDVPVLELDNAAELTSISAVQLSVLANTPLIKERVSLFAKIGVVRADWREAAKNNLIDYYAIDCSAIDCSESHDDESLTYGAGIFLRITDRWTARLEFDRWDEIGKQKTEVDVYSLGIQYRWGQ